MRFIIKSNRKDETNWSGKEFSMLPCKIYVSLGDCMDALQGYWFQPDYADDYREIIIQPLSEVQVYNLLLKRKIRY